ncbi:uncharacterized protein LOC127080587 [Lathyrus oleraceus]|uniref:uncharacterized protein LOC127080587 n=1 Tax=Pisum sativum TaxID=3888 RepID=UPI0021D303A2|nr:uncharacterized protein LOC127080587 [Pisum sativum]
MSKLGFSYCQSLLLSNLYFWDNTYNTFHLPCGMMTPTLFEVAAIAGLPPTGETFDPYQDCENLIDFNVKNASFSTHINLYHADEEEVSDIEHIAFLGLWLSKFFFCCKSLQVAKRFLTLANQLHAGRRVGLSELLLASLYENLGSTSAKLKEYEAGTNLLLSGPYWLLQLWLNATFESFLPTRGNIEENAPEIINRSIEGTRLLRLTPADDVDNVQTSLTKYTLMFSKRHHFLPSMAPFASRTHGPSWFTASLKDAMKNANTEIEDIWRAFLLPRLLVSRILPVKSHVCLLAYQPNFVSRQFGLCQLIPFSLFKRKCEICCAGTEWSARDIAVHKEFHSNCAEFQLIAFQPSFYSTNGFATWWTDFYSKNMFSTAEIKEHLTKAFSSLKENVPKGKLTHSAEIQAFQKYFETVYDPTNIVGTVCYAAPILKEKFEKQIAKRKSLKASFKHLHVSTNSHSSLAIKRKVAKKEKPVAKASSTTASRPTTSSSQGVPSSAALEKTKKSSKGSGKPPLTPKKRKTSPANIILVEDDEEDTPPTPLKKKQKKNKDKATTPLISTANQSDPSSGMNPSPPLIVSGAIQNKGSSTGAQNLEEDNAQNKEETSSPGEGGKRDSKHVDEKDSTGKENSEDTPSNSLARVAFPSNDVDEDDQDSDEIEGYFLEDEDMNMGEADTEGNQTGTSNASVDTVPNPTKINMLDVVFEMIDCRKRYCDF